MGHSRAGRHIRSLPVSQNQRETVLDLPATLRANLLRGGGSITSADFRQKQFRHRQRALIVFVIDASESMGEGSLARMQAAKGAVLGLLTAAYQNRDQVALVAFRGHQAQVLLQPTSSVLLAQRQLRKLPLGGATPFADGLWRAWQLIHVERRKQPKLQPLLVIVSDGEANVPLAPGAEVFSELSDIARQIAQDRVSAMVIDSHRRGSSQLRRLASELVGGYRQIRDLHAGQLIDAVQAAQR